MTLTSTLSLTLSPTLAGANVWTNVFIFGSSNIGATAHDDSAIFPDQIDDFVEGIHYKLDHNDELVTFSSPVNNNNSATYNLVNEDMAYGVAEMLVTGIAKLTGGKVAVVSAVESARPVSTISNSWLFGRNASNPFDQTTAYGQSIQRAKNLINKTGAKIALAYLPDAGRDAGQGYTATNVYNAYIAGIANLRTDLNCPDMICVVPNVTLLPSDDYTTAASISAKLSADLEANATNTILIEPDQLGISLGSGIQWEYDITDRVGSWVIGNDLTGGTSGNSGKISSFNNSLNRVWTENKVDFTAGETLTATNGTTATLSDPITAQRVHYNTNALNKLSGRAVRAFSSGKNKALTGELILGVFGDSTAAQNSYVTSTANAFENVGVAVVLNYLLKNRFTFSHALNKGVSGDKIADLVARKTDMGTLAGLGCTDLYIAVGTNDLSAGTSSAAMIEDLDEIISYGLSAGIDRLIFEELSPRGDSANEATRIAFNDAIKARLSSRVKYVPIPALWDTDIHLVDGVHKSPAGAYEYAQSFIQNHPAYTEGADIALTENLIDGDMSDTSGTIGSAVTGVLPTGWSASANGTNTASWFVCSKTEDDKLLININIPKGSGASCGFIIGHGTVANSGVNSYESRAEYDINITSGDIRGANLEIREEGSGSNIYHVGMDERGSGAIGISRIPSYGRGIAECPLITTVSGSTALRPRFVFSADATREDVVARIIIHGALLKAV